MVKNLLILMLLTGWCFSAYAQDPVPEPALNDFAYGIPIIVDGAGAIYGLDLPVDVYKNTTREDLGDIRVFNGKNEMVPHAVKRPDIAAVTREPVQVPYFPLYAGAANISETKQRGVSLNINTDESGTIIDVRADGLDEKEKKIQAYLFDLSRITDPPAEIELEWSKQEDNFNITISLDGSSDLNSWQTMVIRQSLAELNFSGHRLFKNKIPLPYAIKRYLRMTWPPEAGDRVLTVVKAIFPEKAVDSPRQWLSVLGTKVKDDSPTYEYDTGGAFPVDRFTIELPEPNSLIQVIVRSRRNTDDAWRDRHRGVFYRSNVEGGEISNDMVSMPPLTDRFWQMEVVSEGSGLGAGMPTLKFGWLKYRLLFLSRGKAPFTLAYGGASVSPPQYPVDRLFSRIRQTGNIDMVQVAQTGDPFSLGGPVRLKLPPPPLPWKKWVLWAVLVLSVVILGLMAVRLFKQMNESKP